MSAPRSPLDALCAGAGFEAWGLCGFGALPPLLPVRSRGRLPGDPQAVLVVLAPYYAGAFPQRNVSRYALGADYHNVLMARLKVLCRALEEAYPGYGFIPFTDSSPIPEVAAASLAGLGVVGKNGLLLHPLYGSLCFIGEIVTDAPLCPKDKAAPAQACPGCALCLRACPSGALGENGFCLEKCRSHITQKKGDLTPWEQEQVKEGGMVWGCDRCLDACPANAGAAKSAWPEFYEGITPILTKQNIPLLFSQKAYGWRGQEVLLRNLRLLAQASPGLSQEGSEENR